MVGRKKKRLTGGPNMSVTRGGEGVQDGLVHREKGSGDRPWAARVWAVEAETG